MTRLPGSGVSPTTTSFSTPPTSAVTTPSPPAPVRGFVITDLRSTNGVEVQGKRIRGSVILDDGDRIRIVSQEFTRRNPFRLRLFG
jgi:hypothetical protein